MEYERAYSLLDSVYQSTDSQIELLVADVQYMRLCQRESKNKNFYDYKERASKRLIRIKEELSSLPKHAQDRFVYAESEFSIVCSTYYYYVGLASKSAEALADIENLQEVQGDTAQYLSYLYQIGSGGLIDTKYKEHTSRKEFEYLFECYVMARKSGMIYWEANSLQAMSEHLLYNSERQALMVSNPLEISILNSDNMPDSLISGYLAQKSLALFSAYGDIYQTAGAYRTLASCYWELGDYNSSLICLEKSLGSSELINQAPDLIASIREQLSLVYAAMNDKNNSDINRNIYLDLQDETRQDRQLEARAEQLERTLKQQNVLIISILVLILLLIILSFLFRVLRRNRNNAEDINKLLLPLRKWKELNNERVKKLDDKYQEIQESLMLSRLCVEKDKRTNVDNRAKVFLLTTVVPYIDRVINEITRLGTSSESDDVRGERLAYVSELTDEINKYNDVLTSWIKLRQGALSLKIETFSLNDVFDILSKSVTSFSLRGINLHVEPSDLNVKADKTLTLFMLNTLADNARKYTPSGGSVDVRAIAEEDYVEISVTDTGSGIPLTELSTIFDHKVRNGHGFGLMNCKGIIDKYRKVSQIFSVCGLFAESREGHGSRFYFRLPHGVARLLILVVSLCSSVSFLPAVERDRQSNIDNDVSPLLLKAGAYADSAYYSNVDGEYLNTLRFADSARVYLNAYCEKNYPERRDFMVCVGDGFDEPAEIKWFRDSVKTDYEIIMDIRNESAVAALALHDWDLYSYNNKVYTQLFKETSADNGLSAYCLTMQRSSGNKTIAVMLLALLLVIIILSYYFLYYRHVLTFRFCVEQINNINAILLSERDDSEKLGMIEGVDTSKYPEPLKTVTTQIKDALRRSINVSDRQNLSIELAEDELNRSRYEDEKFYISNNVIDNCLSTVKHETMYYPSRVKSLVESGDRDISAIKDVVMYYKELYGIFCEQARRQIDIVTFDSKPISLKKDFGVDEYVLGDETLLAYLFDILKKQCGAKREDISVSTKEGKYIVFEVTCHGLKLDERQCQNLFAPSVDNIPFLICRQIARENSEIANLHGCGIAAETLGEVGTLLRVTLARAEKRQQTN